MLKEQRRDCNNYVTELREKSNELAGAEHQEKVAKKNWLALATDYLRKCMGPQENSGTAEQCHDRFREEQRGKDGKDHPLYTKWVQSIDFAERLDEEMSAISQRYDAAFCDWIGPFLNSPLNDLQRKFPVASTK